MMRIKWWRWTSLLAGCLCSLSAAVIAQAQQPHPTSPATYPIMAPLSGNPLPAAPVSATQLAPAAPVTPLPKGIPVIPDFPGDPVAQQPVAAEAELKKDEKKDEKKDDKKPTTDSLHDGAPYGLEHLFDSLHPHAEKGKKWYEKLSLRGYTQFRFTRTVDQADGGAEPSLLGDRSVNGDTEDFSIRRMRLIIFGDVSDHLGIYIQPDFGTTPPSSTGATFFGQLRDTYADVYVDTTKIHRFRVGLSKVPFGFENLQSSQNRIPLDRTDPINTAVSPNERDLGVFYYWTPEDKQNLFKTLVDGGLKGSGNYGIFGIGVYNGQGGSQLEANMNLHTVARFTYPVILPSGQVVEASIQGYTGEYVVLGSAIRPLGRGTTGATPTGTGGVKGIRDQRVAGSFIWYPQPFGFQAEWCVGDGPGLNDAQNAVINRSVEGGYVMAMYKIDTCNCGIWTPYVRYQHYHGGYRSQANAPYGDHDEVNLGVEWQIRKEMELVCEYSFVDGVNLNALNTTGATSYQHFDGGVLRFQFQVNY